MSSNYLSGVYRFAAYKNDRFEIGPALGLGYLSIEAGIGGQGSARPLRRERCPAVRRLEEPRPADGRSGGYLYWWPPRRLLVRGDFRYIIVKPENSEASITDGRGALIFHVTRHVGLGLQYTYRSSATTARSCSTDLGGTCATAAGRWCSRPPSEGKGPSEARSLACHRSVTPRTAAHLSM